MADVISLSIYETNTCLLVAVHRLTGTVLCDAIEYRMHYRNYDSIKLKIPITLSGNSTYILLTRAPDWCVCVEIN